MADRGEKSENHYLWYPVAQILCDVVSELALLNRTAERGQTWARTSLQSRGCRKLRRRFASPKEIQHPIERWTNHISVGYLG